MELINTHTGTALVRTRASPRSRVEVNSSMFLLVKSSDVESHCGAELTFILCCAYVGGQVRKSCVPVCVCADGMMEVLQLQNKAVT